MKKITVGRRSAVAHALGFGQAHFFQAERVPHLAEPGIGEVFVFLVREQFPVADDHLVVGLLLALDQQFQRVVVTFLFDQDPRIQ